MELEAYGHSKISIHALREEGDGNQPGQRSNARRFLSTPSARRATWQHTSADKAFNISIHALREEGDKSTGTSGGAFNISIHALREEGDVNLRPRRALIGNFYPRPPRGGRRPAHRPARHR